MARRGKQLTRTAVALLLLCLVAAADDPLARPHAFDDGIQAVRALLDEGDCKEGLDALEALLVEHKESNYAKARRIEIEELTRSLACGIEHKRPRPKDLVSGKLHAWSPKSGKLRITYTPQTAEDLEARDGLLYLPARFDGPFSVEIKGRAYPTDENELPRVILGGEQHPETGKDQSWRIDCGPSSGGSKRRAGKVRVTIVHFDGDDETEASKRTASAIKAGKPYKLVVKVSKKKISVTLNSRNLGSTQKLDTIYGYLGFRAGRWTEAKISGYADATWIESMVDEVLRTQLAEFEKTYDADEHVPEWLEDPLDQSKVPKRTNVGLIAKLPEKHYDLLLEVENQIRLDEYEEALVGIDKMQAAGVSEATCEYVRATTRERMTQLDRALVHIKRCVELEPAFLDGALLYGSLLRQLGRFDEALKAFEDATAAHAQFVSAYEESASAMLMAGRPEDANRLTQLAARNGVTSEKLIQLNSALRKAVRGPRWTKRFEHKSRNYHVMSNMDQMICREAAKLLEEAFQEYRKTMGWVAEDKTRLFKVFLFKERKGFMGYQGDLEEFMGKPSEMAAGLYSPLLKQLLIWNLPNRDEMMSTVRHEGFHQYLDRTMPNPPVWFNEGLAVYHENAKKVDGKLTFGHLHPNYLRLLIGRGLVPCKQFLEITPSQFYEKGHRSYGQAWLLVHMLRHTTPAYRKTFDTMVKDLGAKSGFSVVRKAFPPATLPKLDSDLRDYLEKLYPD